MVKPAEFFLQSEPPQSVGRSIWEFIFIKTLTYDEHFQHFEHFSSSFKIISCDLIHQMGELTDWGALGAVNLQKKIKKYRENLAVSKRAVFDVF